MSNKARDQTIKTIALRKLGIAILREWRSDGLRPLWRYAKGRVWCLAFHAPVLRMWGGYGGRDHWGRRRKAYHDMWCIVCNNRWEQRDKGERCRGPQAWHWRKSEQPPSRAGNPGRRRR